MVDEIWELKSKGSSCSAWFKKIDNCPVLLKIDQPQRPLFKDSAWHVKCSLPLRSAQVPWRAMESVVFRWHHDQALFSSSYEEKEDLWTPLFFWLPSLPFLCFHCSKVGTAGATQKSKKNPKSLTVLHLPPVYLNRALKFVCSNVFSITARDIQLFVDRNALEWGHFTFSKHCLCSAYFQTLSYFSILSVEPQGQMMKGANERM